MFRRARQIFLQSIVIFLLTPIANAEIRTLEFEDLVVGAQYRTPTGGGPSSFSTVPESFPASEAVSVNVVNFIWSSGTVFSGGVATIQNTVLAGQTSANDLKEISANNINLDFGLGPVSLIQLRFGEYGGNINLNVNGTFRNIDNFEDIQGDNIGGAVASVVNGLGNDQGILLLTGPITSFQLGGQELWIDTLQYEVTPTDPCGILLDFEDLLLGSSFRPTGGGGPAKFLTNGITVKVQDFVFSGGGIFSGGFAQVENTGLAGGSGQDLEVNNVNLQFEISGINGGAEFDYGEYGGNVNVNVNGDFRNVDNFSDLNGLSVGGVLLSVSAVGPLGTVTLEGEINSLAIGGQELFIDNFKTKCVAEPGPHQVPTMPTTLVFLLLGLMSFTGLRQVLQSSNPRTPE